jgi:predicted hydrocarbon binding protein
MPFRYQRFLDCLDAQVAPSVREKLLNQRVPFESLSTNSQTTKWIKQLVDDLPDTIGVDTANLVMESCGQQCIGQSILEKAIFLRKGSRDIDEFLDKLNQAHIGGGKLRREDQTIYASYDRCYCGSVSKTRVPISTTYCHCSCGWYKKLFETALEKSVTVELIDSIVRGAKSCQFIIHI